MAVGRNFRLSANVCLFLCIYVFFSNYKSLHLQSNTSPNDSDVYILFQKSAAGLKLRETYDNRGAATSPGKMAPPRRS